MLAVIAVTLVCAAPPGGGSGVALAQTAADIDDDPAVRRAEAELRAARQQLEVVTDRLDALAQDFENARGHAERLAAEVEGSATRLDRAEEAAELARRVQAEQVRNAYMQPGLELARMSGAFLLAPDANTALHTTALMERVAAATAREVEAQVRAGQLLAADVDSQRQIAGGSAATTRDLEQLTATFTEALDAATADVAVAEAALADARTRAREEAERQAEEEQRQAQAEQQQAYLETFAEEVGDVSTSGIRIATINGERQEMACPLGQPNGFVDSWGAPRSGGRTHKGVDMFASYGMPVFAAADGVVRRVFNNTLGGLSIDLVDGLGNRYYYAHLSAAYVVDGQQVRAGELLAANGNSGNAIATPPHVHWQFHPKDGVPVNPYPLAAALCR